MIGDPLVGAPQTNHEPPLAHPARSLIGDARVGGRRALRAFVSAAGVALVAGISACGGDDGGTGTATFTTWGEEYIEEGIPADPTGQEGFVDGWALVFEKFLVHYTGITVADSGGAVGARLEGSRLVDNVHPGRKTLVQFAGLEAKSWDRVSYQITPARADAVLVSATADDRDRMVQGGYSLYVLATATKGAVTKKLRWGFAMGTDYTLCEAEQGGKLTQGLVVRDGAEDVSELTTHADHLFYDRLQAGATGTVTSLRFDAIAAADTDGDGEITLDELAKVPLDVKLYDPSGLPAGDMKAFVTALARTVGHYRGEGECAVRPD